MNDSPSHPALRELRQHLTTPQALVSLGAVAVTLAIVGPFETRMRLGLVPALGYWAVLVCATYAAGTALDIGFRHGMRQGWLRVLAQTLATVAAVIAIVGGWNLMVFGTFGGDSPLAFVLESGALAVVISGTLQWLGWSAAQAVAAENPPPLLERLPLDKRGRILALSVEDHYTRVRTNKGEELVLMRLGDAIREAAPEPGLQVHRSHWVAIAAVTAAVREGDRAVLSLSHGGDIPASRSHIPALKEAGLLPR